MEITFPDHRQNEERPHYLREQYLTSQLVKRSVVDVLLIHLGWTTRLQLDTAV